ncbi:MAG: alpha/beta hydrolase [Bacteroidetes bacterium]|nr:alpha/beta hydrolase [Bacteroidota bacterium]
MENTRIIERQFHVPVGDDGLFVKLLLHASPESEEVRPTWVFLHEALGSVGQWKSFPFELCKASGCDGIVYDRVGSGHSTPQRKAWDLDFYREEAEVYLHGLLQALNVRRPLLFGHSDGATIALKFASSFPDSVVGVVSEAAHVVIEDVTINGIRDARERFQTTDLPMKLARFHGEKTATLFSSWADTWLDPALAEWNMLDDLHAIRCPVLIVQGDEDDYGSRKQVDAIAEHVRGQSDILWLHGTGHSPHLQTRPIVLAETLEWAAPLIEKNAG